MFAWFATFRCAAGCVLGDADRNGLVQLLAATPGLARGLIFSPATTRDPYLDDGAPPALALQLYFPRLELLEAALSPDGHLQRLPESKAVRQMEGATVGQQAMLVRQFPVPDPEFRTPAGEAPCSYLVAYDGPAEDLGAWLHHYISAHTGIMARFPGIRQIEVCTRVDWSGFLPWPGDDCMLRNKVVFDCPAALTEALNAPVRHEMRADFQRFPAFSGKVTHFPMATQEVLPP